MKHHFRKSEFSALSSIPLRIATAYLFVGAAWILLSDKVLWMVVKDPATLVRVSIFKGWFFIGSTALMLYGLIKIGMSRIRQSVQEAQLSETKYREIVEGANNIIIRKDIDDRITLFNRFAEELFGISQQEVLGQKFVGTIVPEADAGGDRFDNALADMAARPLPMVKTVTQANRRNGDRIWIDWTVKPIVGQDGRVVEMLCIGNDITADRLAREAVLENEQKFQDILNRAPSAIYIKNLEGRYTFVNSHFERLSGFSRKQVLDRCDTDLFPPEVARQSAVNDRKAYDMQFPLETEEIAPVGGEMHTFISAKFPLYDARGKAYAICGISTDIEPRKQAERKSDDMLRFMQTLLDTIPSPIFYEDEQGKLLGCNHAFESNIGLGKDRLAGKDIAEIAPGNLAHMAICRDLLLHRKSGKMVYESQIMHADGQRHDVICSVAAFLNAEAEVAGLVGVMTDITERKKAERENEQLIVELQGALSKVRLLSGFLPICAKCKKIRDDQGYWQQIEAYIRDHSEAEFSHSICPDCAKKMYPGLP